MTKLDFPDTPSTGQQFGSAGTVWRWDGTRWGSTAGAAGARGQVAYNYITSGVGGIAGVATDIISVSFSPNPSRLYRITAYGTFYSNTANDVVNFSIRTSGGTVLAYQNALMPIQGQYGYSVPQVIIAGSALGSSITLKTTAYRSYGTGTCVFWAESNNPSFILVEDITYEAGATGAGGSVPPAPRYVSTDAHLATPSTAYMGSTPYTITPLDIAITPLSANSKFLIRASLMVGHVGCDDTWWYFFRNGVYCGNAATGSGSNAFRYHRFTAANNLEMAQLDYEYIDSPNTTAIVHYIPGCLVRVGGGSQTLYFNRRGADATIGGRSSMFVQEIP